MRTFIASVLGGIVALILFIALTFFMVIGFVSMATSGSAPTPRAMVLEIDLRDPIADQPAQGAAAFFSSNSFLDILQKLDAAASDPRVSGVYIRASEFGVGHSRAEELRAALQRLQDSNKFVIAHSQGFIGFGPSGLRAISTADELWLQPGTEIAVPGMTVETLFMKDLFDNLSVTAEIEQFYEFKNAPNVYKETDYTEAHREAMTELISDIWTISVKDIAEDRGFTDVDAFRAMLESGAISADDALSSGLVDKLSWPEEAEEAAIARAGEGAALLPISSYKPILPAVDAPLIAIVGGEGAIVTGEAEPNFFNTDAIFASDRIAEALLTAGRDENVRAIVFRVDSPGGSAIASDQIWRAVKRVRQEMSKPVIVSMGSVAASGGYYVSAGADVIMASETTITGSIGVYGGKYAIADGLRRIGVNPSTITVGGDLASAFSLETFTDTQRAEFREGLTRVYDRFMEIVADGRELDEARVREIARGRVWSGVDGVELNLVSEIGGFIDAIDKAKELADIPADTRVRTAFYPAPATPEMIIADMFGASAESAEAAARFNALMENPSIQALMEQSEALNSRQTQMRAPVMIER